MTIDTYLQLEQLFRYHLRILDDCEVNALWLQLLEDEE